LKKSPKKSVRVATHVRVAIAVRVAMVKVVARQVHAVALLVVLAVPAATGRLENNDAATETQKVSQRAEGS
jgi:hypothetical protein